MKIQKTIKASSSFVFDKIIQSGLYDIERQTGKKLTASKLKGFEYSKKFTNNNSGRIKFIEIVEPSVYAFDTVTNKMTHHTRWTFEPVGENSTRIIIEETEEITGWFDKLNHTAMAILLGWSKKRQMIYVMNSIESEYKAK